MNNTQTRSSDSRKKISGSTIKIIAIITMLIGIAASAILDRMLMKNGLADVANNTEAYQAFMESNGTLFIADFVMQLIGGLALPLFCFLLTEGFMHTSSLKNMPSGWPLSPWFPRFLLISSTAAAYGIPTVRILCFLC